MTGLRAAPALVPSSVRVPASLKQGVFTADRQLQAPPGFTVSVWASVPGARSMVAAPWGEVLVTQPERGRIVALSGAAQDAAAVRAYASGLQCPYGMAFRDDYLYLAQETAVVRFKHNDGGALGPAETVVSGLPNDGCGPHHYRPLTFDGAGNFYVAVGSSCNVCVESDQRRGTVWQFTLDGASRQYAAGLRNTVDLAINPASGELWGVTNERDELGDDVPPDWVSPIQDGANYGWPFCFWNNGAWKVDTRVPARNPSCGGLTLGNGIQAHSAPLGITFYAQQQFPAEYQGNAFVALHGSWNRSVPTGYKVIMVPAADGTPQAPQDFVTGWLVGGSAWGRPVDVIVAQDGSLAVSDDGAGVVYRMTYAG